MNLNGMCKTQRWMWLFTRRKKRFCIFCTFFVCAVLFAYQVFMHSILSRHDANMGQITPQIRGAHRLERLFYVVAEGRFTCITSGEKIEWRKVNDDYCDCADGTDEPGTNACPDGIFHCYQSSPNKKYPTMIPSTKVNDGICDCCDGSDEYKNIKLLSLDRKLQKEMNHFLVPCPNTCL